MKVGLDLSIHCTGVAIVTDTVRLFEIKSNESKKETALNVESIIYERETDKKLHKDIRSVCDAMEITRHIIGLIETYSDGTVVEITVEGVALGKFKNSSNNVKELTELGAIVKSELFRRYGHVDIIVPTSLKKKFTGNGRAEKEEMIAAFTARTGYELNRKDKYTNKDYAFVLYEILAMFGLKSKAEIEPLFGTDAFGILFKAVRTCDKKIFIERLGIELDYVPFEPAAILKAFLVHIHNNGIESLSFLTYKKKDTRSEFARINTFAKTVDCSVVADFDPFSNISVDDVVDAYALAVV